MSRTPKGWQPEKAGLRGYPATQEGYDQRCATLRANAANNRKSVADRLQAKSLLDPNTGCRIWTGAVSHRDNHDYGKISVNGVVEYTHRAAWVEEHGPIPEGVVIRHLCNTTLCFDTAHLAEGTPKDNTEDMIRAGRGNWTGRRLSQKEKLTIPAMRTWLAMTDLEIASDIGVSGRTVNRTINDPTGPDTLDAELDKEIRNREAANDERAST